jgi:hypothetical protein
METKQGFAADLGKISLWLDERETTKTLATGTVHISLPDGTTLDAKVFLYENDSKNSPTSPDYFGFIKESTKKQEVKKPLTKQVGVSPKEPDDDITENTWF